MQRFSGDEAFGTRNTRSTAGNTTEPFLPALPPPPSPRPVPSHPHAPPPHVGPPLRSQDFFYIYGGEQLAEEVAGLANECAHLVNRSRSRLEGEGHTGGGGGAAEVTEGAGKGRVLCQEV